MKFLQKLGRALMQAVAVLPVAALLTGIGYAIDPSDWGGKSAVAAFFIQSGLAVLDNLGIIFAIAIAYGLTKDKDGAAALSGLVGYKVVVTLLKPATVAQLRQVDVSEIGANLGFQKMNDANVFVGIIVGIVAALIYDKFHDQKLPDAFAFFAGRRLVPILTSLAAIGLAAVLFVAWPFIFAALVAFGVQIKGLGALGAGIYAFFNRLLIPTGLHHALNAVFWFDIAGINDIPNFLMGADGIKAGVSIPGITGMYQAGFFPIMMFGLPGAALAMYHSAKSNKKKMVYSLLIAGAVASFVTGVTEPLEFSFMFLAPVLYLVHAFLTAVSVWLAATMHWMAGFGFSAGAIDMALSSRNPLGTMWYMLILQGLVFFALYYFVFRFFIKKYDLKTPGREDDIDENEGEVFDTATTDFGKMAEIILKGLGGKENITSLDYCATRLRVEIKDYTAVKEAEIKKARISGVVRPSQKTVQVIVGPQVQFVHDEVKRMIESGASSAKE